MTEPGYWMHETGGQLAPAIRRYLEGQPLSGRDFVLIRMYLQQWIDSEVWDANPKLGEEGRTELARLRELARLLPPDRSDIEAWISLAVDFGLDPL